MKMMEFIRRFNLRKVHKIGFPDGRAHVERMMYSNERGFYVFYDNDLCGVEMLTDSHGNKYYRLTAGYSWYH